MNVTTWTDLPCRCSTSDDGWVIVFAKCPEHRDNIPDLADFLRYAEANQYGHTYGPTKLR
jgi:hypothetical protein